MSPILMGLLYILLLFSIFFEGQADTPRFFSLPHTRTDYVRILMHSLEFLVVTWFLVGPIIFINSGFTGVAEIEIVFALCLGFASLYSKQVDPRFSRTGFHIAFWFGLLSLPYLFLFS